MELSEKKALEVYIDSSFNDSGTMTLGEVLIRGRTPKEVLISTYILPPFHGE